MGISLREDFVKAAIDALEDGLDTRSLRMLAGLDPTEADEARKLFDKSLTELDISKPNQHDAVMQLARYYAQEILSGRIAPLEGAKRISALSMIPRKPMGHELDTFVYGASEWEDRPEDGPIFEKGILAAATELVSD